MDFFLFVCFTIFVFFMKTKGLLPLGDPFVLILQYVLCKIKKCCEFLNVNILNKRNVCERIFLYQITFCNLKAKTFASCLQKGPCVLAEGTLWVFIGIICELNQKVMMLKVLLIDCLSWILESILLEHLRDKKTKQKRKKRN